MTQDEDGWCCINCARRLENVSLVPLDIPPEPRRAAARPGGAALAFAQAEGSVRIDMRQREKALKTKPLVPAVSTGTRRSGCRTGGFFCLTRFGTACRYSASGAACKSSAFPSMRKLRPLAASASCRSSRTRPAPRRSSNHRNIPKLPLLRSWLMSKEEAVHPRLQANDHGYAFRGLRLASDPATGRQAGVVVQVQGAQWPG